MSIFQPENTHQFETGIQREWIITNGLGGYASSTMIGANTRTYHGLLVAALTPPIRRILMLSSIDEEIRIGDTIHQLASHRYQGAIYPEGFRYIKKFQVDPFVRTTFEVEGMIIEKEVFMPHGHNMTIISYEITNPGDSTEIRLYPLVNMRSIHSTTRSNDLEFKLKELDYGVMISTSDPDKDIPPLFLQLDGGQFVEDGKWYYNFEYDMERFRGQPYLEDNYNPGFFSIDVGPGISKFNLVASTRHQNVHNIENFRKSELDRIQELLTRSEITDEFALKLVQASDSFLVHRNSTDSTSVIAGYHWFSDWGRDAMISLPGLTLVTKRFDEARQIFLTFARYCKDGQLPNRFPDSGEEADYNTVDASLWYFHALYRYLEYTKDYDFVKGLWSTLEEIIYSYRDGTSFGIRMDDDGLIISNRQLTWMDAMVGNTAFTPRAGKACEINALWYNALKIMEELSVRFGFDELEYSGLARRTRTGYAKFWNEEIGCLYDVIDVNGDKDRAVRPNQVIAVSMPFSLLSPDKEKSIVEVVQRELLTPFGLRTLSMDHPEYQGYYAGDAYSRDSAYHQGTVWPWLLGPFVTAFCKVNQHSSESRIFAKEMFQSLNEHLSDAGIGTISEIFDGNYPHEPRGCISQSWSVAEILRSYIEDVLSK